MWWENGKQKEKILVSVHTNIFISKQGRNTHNSYSAYFYNHSHGCSWYLSFSLPILYSFCPQQKLQLVLVLCLPVDYNLIPERSEPLPVLPLLSCCFPWILIIEYGDGKRHLWGSPAS